LSLSNRLDLSILWGPSNQLDRLDLSILLGPSIRWGQSILLDPLNLWSLWILSNLSDRSILSDLSIQLDL
jgi:hypothetical protein